MQGTRETRRFAGRYGRLMSVGLVSVVVMLGIAAVEASPALARTWGGSASGSFDAYGHGVGSSPPCAVLTAFDYNQMGSGTYLVASGNNTVVYNGPVSQTVDMDPNSPPVYGNPFGTHGTDSTCNSATAGDSHDVIATARGSNASGSVSCDYTGTVSRLNPTGGNGTDTATAYLVGTCTVQQNGVTLSSTIYEERSISYVNGSCVGGPPPIHCSVTEYFNDSSSPIYGVQATTPIPLAAAIQGTTYSQTLTAIGGYSPYSYVLSSGSSIPAGLSLSSAGVISGTPTVPGFYGFTVDVTDSSQPPVTTTEPFSLTVNPTSATHGVPYSENLVASWGISPYTFSLHSSSSLPAGLSLSSTGVISGTPTSAGFYTFTVDMTDSGSNHTTVSQVFALTVN